MDPWRPLSRRDDALYDVLVDGVPGYLRASAWAWAETLVRRVLQSGSSIPDEDQLLGIERALRIQLEWHNGSASAYRTLQEQVFANEDLFLDMLDWLLRGTTYKRAADSLESALVEAGSAWTVVERGGKFRLERRVDQTVADASAAVMVAGTRAGQHLLNAWASAYGRSPDASSAYREAVRAVEAAGAPIISPNNPKATLGTLIADVRQGPSKWKMRFSTPPSYSSIATLQQMLELLWKSQFDRHGTPDNSVPLNVSLEEAQDAVHLAVALVQWFESGAVVKT